MQTVNRIDRGDVLANAVRQDGMLRVAAHLTRVGVFTYHKPDGSVWKEFRPDTEVFSPDSLASYAGRPLTVGHRLDAVTANSWAGVAVGDVRDDATRDGEFVKATVQVNDAPTVNKVDTGDLVEVSCGYKCKLELTPGTYQGEHYDAIQRNIRLNHVALLPSGRARGGKDVRLLLDSSGDVFEEVSTSPVGLDSLAREMAENEDVARVQKERNDALDEIAALKKKLDESNGAALAAKTLADQARADATKTAAGLDAKVAARVALIDQAKKVMPELRADGKSDLEIKRDVILKLQPSTRLDGLSEDFVNGLYTALVSGYDGGRGAVEQAIRDAAETKRADAQETRTDAIEAARARMYEVNEQLAGLSDKDLTKLIKDRKKATK